MHTNYKDGELLIRFAKPEIHSLVKTLGILTGLKMVDESVAQVHADLQTIIGRIKADGYYEGDTGLGDD